MCGYCGCSQPEINQQGEDPQGSTQHHHHTDPRIIQIEQDILAENQRYADQNRDYFNKHHIVTFNLVSSPGSGKTTLLAQTITALKESYALSVIEGDQHTDRDRQRIAQTGVPVLQINTGKTCHLDAHRISHALAELSPKEQSILFIENVGNLVCPALFDLGERAKVVILSVTEGDDKPLKYPHMFEQSQLLIINKIDLLPHVTFDVKQCIVYAKQINPTIDALQLSATTREGMTAWCDWLTTHDATLTN